MKRIPLFLFSVLLFSLSLLILPFLSPAFLPVFAREYAEDVKLLDRDLKFGMRGADVTFLQKILNADPDTRVESVGEGSSGMETDFFGKRTKAAVVKFQEKYRQDVLIPAGLYAGTGIAGPMTRKKINTLVNTLTQSGASVEVSSSPVLSPAFPAPPASVSPPPENFSLDQIQFDEESFFRALDTVGREQGYDPDTLTALTDAVRKDVVLNRPQKRFLEEVQKSGVPIHGLPRISYKAPRNFLGFLGSIRETVFGKSALALQGATPFGGRLLFAFYCTCSGNWLVVITPLAPSYATLLTYYTGTQAYMGYNIPFTVNMVGSYTQGSQCMFYYGYGCASLPSQGQIGSVTGSSPI